MKQRIVEKILRYSAIFEPCEEGGFTVTVPKLPGVVTEGDTFEEAKANVEDAIKGYLEILSEAGESIPEPDSRSFSAMIDIKLPRGSALTGI
jgi:predicted RNase H-like HicB family nuclease